MAEIIRSGVNNWSEIFKNAGAIWNYSEPGPHVAYEQDDKHSDFYFNTDVVVGDESLMHLICEGYFHDICLQNNILPDQIVSPSLDIKAGAILAARVAKSLGVSFAAVDLEKPSDQPIFRNKKILIVVDDVHSGKSLKRTLEIVIARDGRVEPVILTLANFSDQTKYQDFEVVSLINPAIEAWASADCPLCKKRSRALKARQHWQELIACMRSNGRVA